MAGQKRREFVRNTAIAAAVATTARAADKTTLALIGCGGQGMNLVKSFAQIPGVTIAYVCDPDAKRASDAATTLGRAGQSPKTVADLRRVLDDRSVDAVVIATPDHWHAPATILACAAGKHVYVEKPASHNIAEGRLMVEAARRHKRVVQLGTQSRSAPHIREAMELLKSGAIGDILVAKAWNSQLRGNIGHGKPTRVPNELDYDLWIGPTPMTPYQENTVHYGWHWRYAFGTGDMGNDGVHDIDIARWGLGVDTHPSSVVALGGKYFFNDDQEFPDTQYVAFEYPGDGAVGHRRQLIFEQRIWSPYVQEGYENGDAFYGTKGMLLLGKGVGWIQFGERNRKVREMKASGMGRPHHENFLAAIKTGERPNADIEIGHLSSSLCHLGNIATRLGRSLRFDPKMEQIVDDKEANNLVARQYREGHWAIPKVS